MDSHKDKKDNDDIDLEDPLGIAQQPVPKSASDPHTEYDEESVRRRRQRAMSPTGDEHREPTTQSDGASGIDMGGGGDGTDVKT